MVFRCLRYKIKYARYQNEHIIQTLHKICKTNSQLFKKNMIEHFEDPNSSKIRQPWENLVECYGGAHWRLCVENNVIYLPCDDRTNYQE